VLPLTGKSGQGVMMKFARTPAGVSAQIVSLVAIYSFTTLHDPEIEILISTALGKRELFKIRSLVLDEHPAGETCIVHTPQMCLSSKEVRVIG
jgi:hypothetical protein